MERNISSRDKKFVQDMLANSEKSHKIVPESKNPDVKEVEQLTESIRRKLQRGEAIIEPRRGLKSFVAVGELIFCSGILVLFFMLLMLATIVLLSFLDSCFRG